MEILSHIQNENSVKNPNISSPKFSSYQQITDLVSPVLLPTTFFFFLLLCIVLKEIQDILLCKYFRRYLKVVESFKNNHNIIIIYLHFSNNCLIFSNFHEYSYFPGILFNLQLICWISLNRRYKLVANKIHMLHRINSSMFYYWYTFPFCKNSFDKLNVCCCCF